MASGLTSCRMRQAAVKDKSVPDSNAAMRSVAAFKLKVSTPRSASCGQEGLRGK
jgi:hypothetical protein